MLRPLAVLAALFAASVSFATQPFEVTVAGGLGAGGIETIEVSISVPEKHHLYAARTSVVGVDGTLLSPEPYSIEPTAVRKPDPFTGEMEDLFESNTVIRHALLAAGPSGAVVRVSLQGCSETICFRPQSVVLRPGVAQSGEATATDTAAGSPAEAMTAAGFTVARKVSGFLPADEFLAFLKGSGAAAPEPARKPWAILLFVLTGGLLLNLTPCVLPMIPINIAIIGAGTRGGSRARGLLLGGAYGLGISIAYGVLGVVAVLTGAKFGTLNASPVFNLAIAALFLVLALGMFGVINVDLSRFQSAGPRGGGGGVAAAFILGAVAALLAGACVAPVLIWVLVLAADLYAAGNPAGLALPFLLGAGMGLPWPFAGAGLSFLPKPGKWMNYVKYAFGIAILATALWYGSVGARLLRAGAGGTAADLESQLSAAARSGKPVLLDFWATWCKNCHEMERTTFREPRVAEAMKEFTLVKFQAEKPQEPEVAAVMDRYGVPGLPTYVILEPAGGWVTQ